MHRAGFKGGGANLAVAQVPPRLKGLHKNIDIISYYYNRKQWRRFLLNGGETGVQGQNPGQKARGRSPPEVEKKLNFDNIKPF